MGAVSQGNRAAADCESCVPATDLVAETMRAMGLDQATSELLNLRKRNSGLTDYQKVESIVVLMAASGDCYDDMAVLRSDAGLQRLLAIRCLLRTASAHFGANAAWYRLSMLTYNVLSAMNRSGQRLACWPESA